MQSNGGRVHKTTHNADGQLFPRYTSKNTPLELTIPPILGLEMFIDTFDLNFCYPVRELENDWVKLTPFNVCVHERSSIWPRVLTIENDRLGFDHLFEFD